MAITSTAAEPDAASGASPDAPSSVSSDTPVLTERQHASAALLLLCEHASNHVPARYANLGLSDEALQAHIAWDPGALPLAQRLSAALDAMLVHSTVSRLVYDCNRPPEAPSAMPEVSESTPVPGNRSLGEAQRAERIHSIYEPFHDAVDFACEQLARRSEHPAIVTVHSFTPRYRGQSRDVQIGILHDSDSRLADAMLRLAPRYTSLDTRRNEPYGPDDGVTHTLLRHALPRRWSNVMLEVRNDLLRTATDIDAMAATLSDWLVAALAEAQAGDEGARPPLEHS